MIRAFRKMGDTWLGKAIIVLVIVSFIALFGAGSIDQLFRVSNSTAITVKDRKITGMDVMVEFQKETEKLRRIMPTFSYKEAAGYGLLSQTINHMIYYNVMEQVADDIFIKVPDEVAIEYIRSMPEFQDEEGVFRRDIMLQALGQLGFSERSFIDKVRTDVYESFIMGAARSFPVAPALMADLYNKHRSYTRDALVAEVDVDAMKIKTPATEEELREFYDENRAAYMLPEYRDIAVAQASYEDILKNIRISEEDLQYAFDEMKEELSQPEERQIYVLAFDENEGEAAQKAAAALRDGRDFAAVAKENQFTKEDFDWGFVPEAAVVAEVGNAVFNAGKGDIVGPISDGNNHYVVKVLAVKPFKAAVFSEKRKALEERLRQEAVNSHIADMTIAMEDDLAIGMPLKELAEKYGLKFSVHKRVKMDEAAIDGRVISQAFSLEEKEASAVMEMKGGLFVVETDTVYEPELRPYDAVKADVRKAWERLQREQIARDMVQDILVRANAADVKDRVVFPKLASDNGLKTVAVKGISFEEERKDLEKNEILRLFDLRLGEAFVNNTDKGYRIISLQNINPKNLTRDAEVLGRYKTALEEDVIRGLEQQFYMDYVTRYNVKTDEKVIVETFSSILSPSDDY